MATVDSDSLSRALGAGGELAQRFNEVWEQLWQQDHVPPRILEMCRLRLATLLGAEAEMIQACLPSAQPALQSTVLQEMRSSCARTQPARPEP